MIVIKCNEAVSGNLKICLGYKCYNEERHDEQTSWLGIKIALSLNNL